MAVVPSARIEVGEHSIAYRSAGSGPALVLRNASDTDTARLTTQTAHDGTPLIAPEPVALR